MNSLNILLIEPYFTGSHKVWAKGLQDQSKHNIQLLTILGKHWKWRMHGGAVTLAKEYLKLNIVPDLILATDMLDLTTFLALTKSKTGNIPTAVYFHENQLTYPWSPTDEDVQNKRDNHYSFINYTTALAADKVFFNSAFHKNSFLKELNNFLKSFPDYNELETVKQITTKSEVLYLGMDLQQFDANQPKEKREGKPLLLWNHRWEYDKNPKDFFKLLYRLQEENIDFEIAVLGESFNQQPSVFEEAKNKLGDKVVYFGYAETFEEYSNWIWQADILPVTSNQDFFGGSVVEAMYCNTRPLLPNRLAYPEHIPKEKKKETLYTDFEELFHKTKVAIANIHKIRSVNFSNCVSKYDWKQSIANYDKTLLSVAGNKKASANLRML